MSGYLPPMGLELKGSVEEFQSLVRAWQDRDESHQDIEFMFSKGGDDWLCNTLLTHGMHGINDKSIDQRIARFGSNRRKRVKTESIIHNSPKAGGLSSGKPSVRLPSSF